MQQENIHVYLLPFSGSNVKPKDAEDLQSWALPKKRGLGPKIVFNYQDVNKRITLKQV
jgi:hypothetical protein